LIKKDAINIVVPYAERIDEFQLLKREAEQNGLSRSWVRRATPLAVSLFRPPLDSHIWPYLIPVSSLHDDRSVDWYILAEKSHYDPLLGLAIPDVQNSLIA
jgi:CRISPR-associated endonuclease/helicase Cas3